MTAKVLKVERSWVGEERQLSPEEVLLDKLVFEWLNGVNSVDDTSFRDFSRLIEELEALGLSLGEDKTFFDQAERREEFSDFQGTFRVLNSFLSLSLLVRTKAGEVTYYRDEAKKNKR